MRLKEETFEDSEFSLISSLKSRFTIQHVSTINEAITHAYDGNTLFHLPTSDKIFTLQTSSHPNRTPDDPNTEVSIIGARDGFVEDIKINIGLIRRRLKTSSLHFKEFTVGDRSGTKVGLLYVDDIINPEIKKVVTKRLNNLSIDGIISTGQLHELLGEKNFSLFPVFSYTGRPDFCVDSLLRGRFIILIDGLPTATIGPVNLFFMLKSPEDNDYLPFFNSFQRFIRLISLFIAICLPGFYVALTTYHQDQIPFLLLTVLVTARSNVPFPAAFETFLMLGLFELFREAGLRMPATIGQTLTVVGGLIIGDAAVRAGITSPVLIIVIATSLVATYTFTNQAFAGGISIARFFVLSLSAFLGLVGFYASILLLLTQFARMRILTVPYLTSFFPLTKRGFVQTFLRIPWSGNRFRPGILRTLDTTRKGDNHEAD